MPMTVEAVVAYFGVVLAGCAVVSIADSFAPSEIETRLRIANATAIVTQVCCTHTRFHSKLHELDKYQNELSHALD